jgi:hypothetical protein
MKSKKGIFEYKVYTIEKNLNHHLIEWIAAFLSIIGAILNAQLNIYGFYIFMLGNFMWIAFAVKHKHWGLLAANIVFFVLNVYGVWIWMSSPLLA